MTSPRPRTPLQVQASRLFEAHQYKSCELVALMELSQMERDSHEAGVTLEILGDCAARTERHRQANDYFRAAAELVHARVRRERLLWEAARPAACCSAASSASRFWPPGLSGSSGSSGS